MATNKGGKGRVKKNGRVTKSGNGSRTSGLRDLRREYGGALDADAVERSALARTEADVREKVSVGHRRYEFTDGVKVLTERERRAVELYMGPCQGMKSSVAEAMGLDNREVSEILRQDHVIQAMRERIINDPLVADRRERLAFLTYVMRNDAVGWKHRLKAVELLSRAEGDYVTRVDNKTQVKIEIVREGEEPLRLVKSKDGVYEETTGLNPAKLRRVNDLKDKYD